MIRKVKALLYQLWHYRRLIRNPITAVLFFSGRSRAPARFHFGQLLFAVRRQDWVGVDEVLMDDEYLCVLPELESIQRPRILDLGANIGAFAMFVLRHKPESVIYSVEPAEDTFGILEQNCAMNPDLQWRALRAAVWSERGSAGFSRAGSSTGNQVSSNTMTERVPTETLSGLCDNMVEGPIDLIKMDIEGAESCVIPQEEELLKRTRAMVVEIHNDRIDEREVAQSLQRCFPYLYRLPGRKSSKPLILAVRQERVLPVYKPPH